MCFRSIQPKQKPIVEMRGIVDAVLVEDEGVGQRADLEQPVPVGIVPRKAGDFEAQHDSSSPKADLRHQPLKAFPVGRRSSRLTQIVVNDDDAVFGPAQCDGLLAQTVLSFGALSVLEHLAKRRLADVKVCIPPEMNACYLLMRVLSHVCASCQPCSSMPARIRTISVCRP